MFWPSPKRAKACSRGLRLTVFDAKDDAVKHLVRRCGILLFVVVSAGLLGCGQLKYRLNNQVPNTFIPNPLELPPAEDQFVWLQVIDAVDDYFRISREQPVQNSGGMVLDGRVETTYRIGASIFEPWRKDSTAGFERLQSTFQSIRRRAIVTVRPQPSPVMGSINGPFQGAMLPQGGYVIEVVVQKDLEDTDRSQYATESTAAVRHDGTIVRHDDGYDDSPQTLGWIPLGRDTTLEQVILNDLFKRITQPDGDGPHRGKFLKK